MLSSAEINPAKVAVYIRWSTDDQGEGTTLETQLERCRHYLQSQGWAFTESLVYVDDGYSGGTLTRPALTRLRDEVAAGRVQCVVVYKIDRLSRSVIDIVDLVLREWDGRCFVKSTTEDVNTLSPAGKMFFYVLISFAEYERNLIRERTMGGKVKRAEQGLNPGFRPPFGYEKGPRTGTVQVVPHEASLVRRIFELYRTGSGPYQIAHRLNSEGLRRRGALWNPLTIRRMLANPAYAGVLEYGRRIATGTGEGIPRLARVEGAFPSIVTMDRWSEVQRLLQARSTKAATTKPTYSDYLLSGLALCRCGAPVGGKRAGRHRYYYCTARKRQGKAVCDAAHLPVEQVDAAVAERVRAVLAHAPPSILFLTGTEDAVRERIAEVQAELQRQRTTVTRLAERRRRLERDYRSGDLPAQRYAQELDALEQEEAGLRQNLRRLAERLALLEQEPEAPASQGPPSLWDQLSVPERKVLLQRLTRRVLLYKPGGSSHPPMLLLDWTADLSQ